MTVETKANLDTSFVDKWVASEISAGRINGCTIEIIHKGRTVTQQAIGERTPNGDPIALDTQFWIASMTKPVVSVAAMQLIERGDLSLLDPVASYIPGFGEAGVLLYSGETEPTRTPATILDLFIHTAGVTYGQFGDGYLHHRYAEAKVFDYSVTNTEMAKRLAKMPLMYQPGTYFEYGMSTDILGHIIELVTGETLDQALRRIIFNPLGMHNTSFAPDLTCVADLPVSDIQRKVSPRFSKVQVWESGGAGLFSNVSDYSRFALMLRGRGNLDGVQIVTPQTFATMVQQHLPPDVGYGEYTPALGITAPGPMNGLGFGLGFAVRIKEIAEVPGGVGEFFWPGVSGGNFWVDPKHDLITVFLTHAPEYRTEHRAGLKHAVYAGLNTNSAKARLQ